MVRNSVVEHQRVRAVRVVDGDVAGLEHGLAVVLDQQAGAGELQTQLEVRPVTAGDELRRALDDVLAAR